MSSADVVFVTASLPLLAWYELLVQLRGLMAFLALLGMTPPAAAGHWCPLRAVVKKSRRSSAHCLALLGCPGRGFV